MSSFECDWMLDHFIEHDEVKIVEFMDTLPLPSYLFTFNAGPYKVYNHPSSLDGSPP